MAIDNPSVSLWLGFFLISLIALSKVFNRDLGEISRFYLMAPVVVSFLLKSISVFHIAAFLFINIWLWYRKGSNWLLAPLLIYPVSLPLGMAAIAFRSRYIDIREYTVIALAFFFISWQLASALLIVLFLWQQQFKKIRFAPMMLLLASYYVYISRPIIFH